MAVRIVEHLTIRSHVLAQLGSLMNVAFEVVSRQGGLKIKAGGQRVIWYKNYIWCLNDARVRGCEDTKKVKVVGACSLMNNYMS